MGKDWLHWVVGGGGGVGKGKSSGRRGKHKMEEAAAAATSARCMCAVFQLFDLHHFQLPQHHDHPTSNLQEEEATKSKGVEAPRNSLELDQPVAMEEICPKSLAMKQVEENLNFPMGMHIKTGHAKISSPRISTNSLLSKSTTDDISSESKTPTLVARLMGLDLLPESNSPSFSAAKTPSKYKRNDRDILQTRLNRAFSDDDISIGARSLPETPRVSSSRRSDVEYHHRLSLQEVGVSSAKVRRGKYKTEDENRGSPGHYAKQIVIKVKETVSRRVGLTDITNTSTNTKLEKIPIRRDENLILLNKPDKKNSKILLSGDELSSPDGTTSCSPRLRFLDTNKNKQIFTNSTTQSNPLTLKSNVDIAPLKQDQKICRRLQAKGSEQAIRKKKEEPFVVRSATATNKFAEKKMKKTPLMSSEILSISGPTLLPVKKDPSPPATKLPQTQSQVSDAVSSKRSTQLSCNPVYPYKQLQTDQIFAVVPEKILTVTTNGCATAPPGCAVTEYENYIKRILKRIGITDRATPIAVEKWHTPSHPLDPSIFHYLELFHPSAAAEKSVLSRRSNRKLIFQLVDEFLAEILRPHYGSKPWTYPITPNPHLPLVDELCKKISRFPEANCQVLEDIDALVDTDFCKYKANGLLLEEELESIVREIEGDIVESLLSETVAMIGFHTVDEQRNGMAGVTWEALT